MEKLNDIKAELQKILSNFIKSKSRGYTDKTLQEKAEKVSNLIAEAQECISAPATAEIVLQYRAVYTQIKEISEAIYRHIDCQRQSNNNMAFDMKEATALVQYYDGKHEETEAFIEAIELLDELTAPEHKNTMIKFIKTRIRGKARDTISSETTTVAQLKAKLKEKFSTKLSSDAILAKLKACKQGNRKLEDFTEQIENLSRQLSRAFITEQVVTGEAAGKLAEKFSTQAYIDNIANPDTAIILKASNLKTLSEIATKAITVDKPQTSNVLHLNARYRRNVGGNYQRNANNPGNSYNHNRRNWPRPNHTGNEWPRQRTNNTWPRTNNWQHNSQRQNNNNNQTYQSNNSGRQNNAQTYSNYRRVNHYGSGEQQGPQSDTEMIRLGGITQ